MGAVFKRELKNYFTTSLGYIFIGLYLLFTSMSFLLDIFWPNFTAAQPVYYANLLYYISWLGVFLIPILTMRLWPEEKSQKTDYLLLTAPKSTLSIVLGKYFAAVVMFLIVIVASFVYAGLCVGLAAADVVSILINYMGLVLYGGALISIGFLASVLTNNQVIAAIIGFVLCMGSLMLSNVVSSFNNFISKIILWFSIHLRISSFFMGIVAVEDIVFLITFRILMLVVISKIIDMKKR